MCETNLLKKCLIYVITNKEGKVEEFTQSFGEESLNAFANAGFINVRYIKWNKLSLADDYYKDLYGELSYWYQRIKAALGKTYKKDYK
jgi:hypothetical protein